jgi:2-oxoglutarate/2-oxoacid ferredoxin oxidoreductase subunit alpha
MPASRVEATNDFVIKFANVNGSGSASANRLFARSILRMGVPIASRNIFPSTIPGLPTWFEVRVTEAGHLGRRGGVDLMVAMNPQTWDKDVSEIEPGGYLFYDSTRPMAPSKFRSDNNVVAMPQTAICNERYSDPRQRQLFKNIIYVGALASLLGIDIGELERLIAEQFRGKDKLIPPNHEALHLGRDYAETHLQESVGLSVSSLRATMLRLWGRCMAAPPWQLGILLPPRPRLRKLSRNTAGGFAQIRTPAEAAMPLSKPKMN